MSVEIASSVTTLWFSNVVRRRIKNGKQVRFWHDVWIGTSALKDCFPRLFLISLDKDYMVANVGQWVNDS